MNTSFKITHSKPVNEVLSDLQIRYISDREVSEITGKSVFTLRNERSLRKGIPYLKIGGRVRYSLRDVIQYMESSRVLTER